MYMPGLLEQYPHSLVPGHYFPNTFLDRAPLKAWLCSPGLRQQHVQEGRALELVEASCHMGVSVGSACAGLQVPACPGRLSPARGRWCPSSTAEASKAAGSLLDHPELCEPNRSSATGSWCLWASILLCQKGG